MSSTEVWGNVAEAVERARTMRRLAVIDIARAAGLDDSTVRRVLAAEPVRMSSLRLVLGAVGLEWRDVLTTLATAN